MPSSVHLHEPGAVESWQEAMWEQLGERQPRLVVVDTLARNFVGGNESSPQDMGFFVDGVERIRRDLGTAVLVLHHETKEGGTERGTESLRNASFAMYRFKRLNQADVVEVKCNRMKDAEPPAARRVRPQKIELRDAQRRKVGSLSRASSRAGWDYEPPDSSREDYGDGPSDSSLSTQDVKTLRAVDGSKDGARRTQLAKTLGRGVRTISRDLKSLEDRGFLVAEGSTVDRRYRLAAQGRKALA